ncbi:MAG TPA: hypothetical protein VE591_01515, partial [Candidatus Acidoferrum sp.]|nr:hypothetical protein [Candidatus Acidoferrum sp.]
GISPTMRDRAVDIEALFERNADSRLLERRRREELGLPEQPARKSSTPASFGAESLLPEEPPPPRPAALRVTLDARPNRELIPGAVVTIVVTLLSEGDAAVPDVRLRVAVPPDVDPVPGSFASNEAMLDGDALLGEGLPLGTIPAGATLRLRCVLRVLPGTAPLDVVATATAPGVPVVAAPTLRLERRPGHAAYEAPRPFYELEPDEVDEELGETQEAVSSVDAVVDEPLVPSPPAPEPQPEPKLTGVLNCPFGADDVRALERVFAGGIPHGLAAIALLAATACSAGTLGDALGLEPFRSDVASALPRALVAARMRKPTPPVVSRKALAALRPAGEASAVSSFPAGNALVARLDARDLDALRAVLGRDLEDPFLRGVQVLLAIAPREIVGIADAALAQRVAATFASYRRTVGAWLMRVTVRRAVDRRYDALTADEPTLHEEGRSLVAALREVFPT